ncbi:MULTISPECIES: hypothetical protein [unclassified Crossiella]|uniref:hypothetical protein n=1 Tax=unclassified Crossiella TaxID=2620835 RepID=UPI001FFE917F|nr:MULTISPECIES: hypothetical protein [unclassified Crossiella]MCK2238409.1 hypothetical protein [Crossiella sp. S99.2]MCK2256449.1 hypothetical protein [Crossiella sp. S99.1]
MTTRHAEGIHSPPVTAEPDHTAFAATHHPHHLGPPQPAAYHDFPPQVGHGNADPHRTPGSPVIDLGSDGGLPSHRDFRAWYPPRPADHTADHRQATP